MTIHVSRLAAGLAALAFLAVATVATTSLVLTLSRDADADDSFSDVATGTFFHDSTTWLAANGIASGFNDGTFRTRDGINRGQAALWLANYNDAIEVIEAPVDLGQNTRAGFNLNADCPPGKRAIGGGGRVMATDFLLQSSRPVDADTWRVGYRHVASGGPAHEGAAYVVCAPERLPG